MNKLQSKIKTPNKSGNTPTKLSSNNKNSQKWNLKPDGEPSKPKNVTKTNDNNQKKRIVNNSKSPNLK